MLYQILFDCYKFSLLLGESMNSSGVEYSPIIRIVNKQTLNCKNPYSISVMSLSLVR